VFTRPHWTLFFDGFACNEKAGAGVVLIDPNGEQVKYMVLLDFEATNNMEEYEAMALSLGSGSSWSRETPSSSSSRSGGSAIATNPSSQRTSSM
jgi:hypothetical protein